MIAFGASHIGFVLAAYGAAAVVVLGLILRAVLASRLQERALAALAARGVTRQSVPSSGHAQGANAGGDNRAKHRQGKAGTFGKTESQDLPESQDLRAAGGRLDGDGNSGAAGTNDNR